MQSVALHPRLSALHGCVAAAVLRKRRAQLIIDSRRGPSRRKQRTAEVRAVSERRREDDLELARGSEAFGLETFADVYPAGHRKAELVEASSWADCAATLFGARGQRIAQ